MENSKTVTLCEKIKINFINKPVDNWKDWNQLYRMIQKETIEASNRILSVCNIFNSFDTKEESLQWLNNTFNTDKIANVLYQISRNNSKYSYSRNANAISNDLNRRYFSGNNSYKRKIQEGTGNAPMTFTESIPIYTTVQGYKIECVDYDKGYYNIELPLLNTSWKNGIEYQTTTKDKNNKYKKSTKKLELNGGRLSFSINTSKNKRIAEIIQNIQSGNYKLGDSKIQRKKIQSNKYEYYFLMSYTKPANCNKDLLEENILGVDLGMTIPAYCAVNYCDYKRAGIGDNTIITKNMAQENINRKRQRAVAYNLKDGHGRKHKLDGYNGSDHKINNRNSTYNYVIARKIIDNAILFRCKYINMESLKGIHATRVDDRFLKSWTYFDLQQKIENKANENGIEVRYINPYRTSQVCSKCGHWEEGQRLSQSVFQCKSCGYKVNADFNAARNIAMSNAFM